jgi:hypothetical protein
MKCSFKLFSIVLILFLFPLTLLAQDDFKGFSINPRLGPAYAVGYDVGIFLGTELCIYSDQNFYSAEYSYLEEFTIFGGADYTKHKVGFYYGKYWGPGWYRYHLQGGLGPVWGERRISGTMSKYFTGGIFMKAGFKLLPFRFAAIGADVQLNINPENPDIMLMLGIDFGKLMNPR